MIDPIVSVVMPACGRLHYLRRSVDSVFAQTCTQWELVIADDGSDAATLAYLADLAAAHHAVRVINLAHCGRPSIVRNAALHAARGAYVAFLDSDDIWMSRKLELQLAAIKAHPGRRWCYTAFGRVNADGRPLAAELNRPWAPHEGSVFAEIVTGRASIRTPAVLAERSLLLELGGFDESMPTVEDYDLWSRMALCSDVALVDQALVHVRLHDQNHSSHGASAYDWRDYSLAKLLLITDNKWHGLLRHERSRSAVVHAAASALHGNRTELRRIIHHSLHFSWYRLAWWLGLLRLLAAAAVRRAPLASASSQ